MLTANPKENSMAFMKHIGTHGDRKVCILFRQVPGEDHMALVIYPETLQAHWQQAIQSVVESDIAQQAEELADALHSQSNIRLDELNKMLNEMKLGDAAIKKMAQNDASRGMVAPEVKRKAEAEFKASQAAKSSTPQLQATQSGALTDRDIAANMVFQAKQMEVEAKAMIAEAARMKKDAQRMDPNVVAKQAPVVAAAVDTGRRGRPSKTKAAADATQ